jgi:methionine aminopeptidase
MAFRAPQVPHFGKRGKGERMRSGMVFTIEPMINLGDYRVKVLADKWTAVTSDRKLSAQFVELIDQACHTHLKLEVVGLEGLLHPTVVLSARGFQLA